MYKINGELFSCDITDSGIVPSREGDIQNFALLVLLTLKGPGFFVYLKSGGGRIPPPPPSDLGRGATKNSEIWHIRRVGQYERADKISILKIKAFLNYANLC